VHAFNYADFPLWDIVFGTFKNPAHFEVESGFYDGASSRIGEMLIGRDVATPPRPAAPRLASSAGAGSQALGSS